MDGTSFERREGPLTRRLHETQGSNGSTLSRQTQSYLRILRQLAQGEWRLTEWAEELGISEDEMLIELDRQLHHRHAA